MKPSKACIKIIHPYTGKIVWYNGWLDDDCFFPSLSDVPVFFSLRRAKKAAERLKCLFPSISLEVVG